jgi:hypothetical protein
MTRDKTTSEMLAEIGAAHEPAIHPITLNCEVRSRRIVAQNGRTIGFMDCFEANDFVAAAHAAA